MIHSETLCSVLYEFMPVLLEAENAETMLAIGTLSSIETAKPALENHFSQLIIASARIIQGLVKAVNWSKEHSVAAQVDQVLDATDCSIRKQPVETNAGLNEEVQIPEPEMLCFCLHSLMDLLTACGDRLKLIIASSVVSGSNMGESDQKNIETVTRLVGILLRVLTTEAVHKDSLTSAAILICSLVPYSHPDPRAVALQLAALASCTDEDEISAWRHLWSEARPLFSLGTVAGPFTLHPGSLPPFACQALVRAVLCSRSREVVTARLSRGDGAGRDGGSLLFMRAYARICDAVEAAGDLFLVCYALQTLSSCLDCAVAALRGALGGEGVEVEDGVVGRMFARGVEAVWGHCEDPFQGIADQTKEAFPRLMLLREMGEVSNAAVISGAARHQGRPWRTARRMQLLYGGRLLYGRRRLAGAAWRAPLPCLERQALPRAAFARPLPCSLSGAPYGRRDGCRHVESLGSAM